MEHIWTILVHKILQTHLLRAFVANLEIDAIYTLYPESFCDKNLAIRNVFAFSDSAFTTPNYPILRFSEELSGNLTILTFPKKSTASNHSYLTGKLKTFRQIFSFVMIQFNAKAKIPWLINF